MLPTFPNPITKVTFNGKTGKPKLVAPLIHALNTPAILIEKSGFLFQATIRGHRLILGVLPYFIDGQRSMHYDIKLSVKTQFTLIGNISADGQFTILFRPDCDELSPEAKRTYADSYVPVARGLRTGGLLSDGPLDAITIQLLTEADLFPTTPQSITELAQQPCSTDS